MKASFDYIFLFYSLSLSFSPALCCSVTLFGAFGVWFWSSLCLGCLQFICLVCQQLAYTSFFFVAVCFSFLLRNLFSRDDLWIASQQKSFSYFKRNIWCIAFSCCSFEAWWSKFGLAEIKLDVYFWYGAPIFCCLHSVAALHFCRVNAIIWFFE